MPSVKFVKHPNFPQKKCFVTENGYFWKMNVREWAFAEINVANMVAGLTATSNNPTVVLGHTEKGKKGVKTTINKGQGTVKFYANQSGFTMIYLFDTDQFTPVDNVSIQIEVLGRRAPRENEISLTKLDDKTYAITSPDARAYIGDKTDIFNSSGATRNILSFLSGIPSGVNHIMIACHGGLVPKTSTNFRDLCLFAAGENEKIYIDIGNVENIFSSLKGKVAEQCVIWFGGCFIGNNNEFCSKAAKASGCYIVAPTVTLKNKRYPKNYIDILDRFCVPKIFDPSGNIMNINEFCAMQDDLKFTVPV